MEPGPLTKVMMSHSPTMNDVAREAEVALKTVSRFVNGETNISPVLAERIARAIEDLGYRRNLAAASIRPGWTSKVLGLIISDLANPYYSALSQAVEQYAQDFGYLLISASSDENSTQYDLLVDRLLEERVDGLLIVPPRNPGRAWSTISPPIPPVVFIDQLVPDFGADTVVADNFGGSREATLELIRNGAERVAFVGDSLSLHTIRERRRGYVDALEASGFHELEELTAFDIHSSQEAAGAVERLLTAHSADAIFASNNRASVGALIAFDTVGRRVPMIGFDDFEAARFASPGVSVVGQDVGEMGRKAAELLIGRLEGRGNAPEAYTLPTSLVLRGSERL
jgi:LacI family transcriptional regulator